MTWLTESVSPNLPNVEISLPRARDWIPALVVSAACIVLTALWLFAVLEYRWLKAKHGS
jgi:hypothetical protein